MMRTTLILSGIAVACIGGALLMRPQAPSAAAFEDTGEPLFADFVDPSTPTSLAVVAWDDSRSQVQRFEVEQKAGRWVIPSHHGYPADATERMGKAAASFIGVNKDIYFGDRPEDHAGFGLLDPEDPEAEAGERARRFTLKDSAGTVLVDILVGKRVPDKQGYLYVRYPGEKRVYGAKLSLDISTSFSDWIEKDLLRIDPAEVVTVVYEPYQVDEQSGRVTSRSPGMRFDRDGDGPNAWTLAEGPKPPAGKELDPFAVQSLVSAVDNLRIVGVRPSPPELATGRLDVPAVLDLQSRGFFVGNGRLLGNEGELRLVMKDGVTYTLYFGELTFESGLALTAGRAEPATDEAAGDAEAKADTGEGSDDAKDSKAGNRYLLVTVGYDPALDQRKAGAPSGDAPAEGTAATTEAAEGEGATAASEAVPAGPPERLESLRGRFGQWFYVISDDSFQKVHKDPDKLLRDREAG